MNRNSILIFTKALNKIFRYFEFRRLIKHQQDLPILTRAATKSSNSERRILLIAYTNKKCLWYWVLKSSRTLLQVEYVDLMKLS